MKDMLSRPDNKAGTRRESRPLLFRTVLGKLESGNEGKCANCDELDEICARDAERSGYGHWRLQHRLRMTRE
jgi:hypothetical protein